MKPLFSIIIPTYKRQNEVSVLLADFSKQTYKNFEIIIVDDTPDNSIYEIARNCPFVRYYHPPRRLGMVKSRNFGASVAKGKYLIFVDSDIRVSRRFLSSLKKNIFKNQIDGGVCKIHDRGKKHKILSLLFRLFFPPYFIRFVPTPRWGTCAFFRKDAFLSIGGFLEDLVGYTYLEDLELVWRFTDSGYSFATVNISVEHLNSSTGGYPDELFYRVVNMFIIFRKHFNRPPLREQIRFWWHVIGIIVKNIISTILSDPHMLQNHLLSVRKIFCWLRYGMPTKKSEINKILMRCDYGFDSKNYKIVK